jgi:hypothetical protein
MPIMTGSITHCWKSGLRLLLSLWLACWTAVALAGSIEPMRAAVTQGDEGYALSADFAIDLGNHLEEAVTHGVVLTFNLEFTLARKRWYWVDEHVASHTVTYRLGYNNLTRQYRLTVGNYQQNLPALADALAILGRVGAMNVAPPGALKAGEKYVAALRLSLDKSQLPKPFQIDAIANPDWSVEAQVLRWQFTPAGDAR